MWEKHFEKISGHKFPAMSFRRYIMRYALETRDGKFWCEMCGEWINKQRWVHFKQKHRYE